MTTIQQAINEGRLALKTIADNPHNEALLLLEHVCNKKKEFLIAHAEDSLEPNIHQLYETYLERRKTGEPLAYITQEKEFWSLHLSIQPGVLIPRPDTETLIEAVLEIANKQSQLKILDLGTGSGCIALALASELPLAKITASDNSEACLTLAMSNAENLKLTNVDFIRSSWFNKITQNDFDIIVSNPPYISVDDKHIDLQVKRFEPQSALFANNSGYANLSEIIQSAPNHLSSGGSLFVEHGFQQASIIRDYFSSNKFSHIKTHTDLQQLERVTSGTLS